MRLATTILICLLLVATPPVATSQPGWQPPQATLRGPDPRGDVVVVTAIGNQSDTEKRYSHADLVEVWIGNETVDAVTLGLRLAARPPSELTPASTTIGFSWQLKVGKTDYLVGQGADLAGCNGRFGMIRRHPDGSTLTSCGILSPIQNESSPEITVTVPRNRLVNETDYPFGPGLEITTLFATTAMALEPSPYPPVANPRSHARDRAPDKGGLAAYGSTLSQSESHGGLELVAMEPLRNSNGESTTLVYPLTLENHRSKETTAVLTVNTTESSFTLRAPPRLIIPASGSASFPVILSMGFEHRHGEVATFSVHAQDQDDPSRWTRVKLGVYWLDSPQPAGHHNRMFIHSGGGTSGFGFQSGAPRSCESRAVWFNPQPEDRTAGVTESPVPGCSSDVRSPSESDDAPDQFEAVWPIPLQPPLAIGLDFDTTQTGLLRAQVAGGPFGGTATLALELLYCDPLRPNQATVGEVGACPGSWIPLASQTSTPQALSSGSPNTFEFEFQPNQDADFLPHQPHANLALLLTLQADRPQNPPNVVTRDASANLVVKGAELLLPLIEYHDPIDQLFQNVGSLVLTPLDRFEKPVNPGRNARFSFNLENKATQEQAIRLAMEGPNREWARLQGPDEIELDAGESHNVTLLVSAPIDASAGERAELFLVAEDRDDPNVVAISRFRATVVDSAGMDIPDETAMPQDSASTPGPPFDALVFAITLGMGAAAARRARGQA